MKVSIDITLEVSDDQRSKIADLVDGAVSKRPASRAEIKDFLWANGSTWEQILLDRHYAEFADPSSPTGEEPAVDVSDVFAADDDILG